MKNLGLTAFSMPEWKSNHRTILLKVLDLCRYGLRRSTRNYSPAHAIYFLCSQTQTLAFSTSSALLSIHQPEVRSKDTCGSKMLTLEKKITHCKPESLLVYLNE